LLEGVSPVQGVQEEEIKGKSAHAVDIDVDIIDVSLDETCMVKKKIKKSSSGYNFSVGEDKNVKNMKMYYDETTIKPKNRSKSRSKSKSNIPFEINEDY
jgi:hypothetical protein